VPSVSSVAENKSVAKKNLSAILRPSSILRLPSSVVSIQNPCQRKFSAVSAVGVYPLGAVKILKIKILSVFVS
jgi:hypothetical protein